MKTKLILFFALVLLFLITSFSQAKAAPYYFGAPNEKVNNILEEYIYWPVADLVKFTGSHLALTFKSFPPFVIATKGYFKGFAYLGDKVQKSIGTIFSKTGDTLAIIPDNLPNPAEVSQANADFFISGIVLFKDSGKIFKPIGEILAIVPNNLPDLNEVKASIGGLFIRTGQEIAGSFITSVAFLDKTYKNYKGSKIENDYPYTQKLLTRTKDNLEFNFIEKIIGIQKVQGSASQNLYAPR